MQKKTNGCCTQDQRMGHWLKWTCFQCCKQSGTSFSFFLARVLLHSHCNVPFILHHARCHMHNAVHYFFYTRIGSLQFTLTCAILTRSKWLRRPPSYFIKLEDGLEKDTEASRVFPLQYKKALEERTSFAALREGEKLDVCPGGAGAAAEAAAAGAAAATATSGGGGGGGGKAEGSNETKASEVSETTVRDPDEPPKKRRDEQGKKKKKKKK